MKYTTFSYYTNTEKPFCGACNYYIVVKLNISCIRTENLMLLHLIRDKLLCILQISGSRISAKSFEIVVLLNSLNYHVQMLANIILQIILVYLLQGEVT